MNRKENRRLLFEVIGASLSAIVAAYSHATNFFPLPTIGDWRWGILIGNILFFIFMISIIVDVKLTYSGKYPNIIIDGVPTIKPGTINFPLTSIGADEDVRKPISVQFAQVDFSNNPIVRTAENTAKNIRAKISYHDVKNGYLLGSLTGIWADSPVGEGVELLSNGKPKKLYLAVKTSNREPNFFMYGTEMFSILMKPFGLLHIDEYSINNSKVLIKVELIGELTQKEFEFVLYDKGENRGMRIEALRNKR